MLDFQDNAASKTLAMALLRADTEDQVISLLKKAGLWDEPTFWRPLGDNPGNLGTVGNQQSKPEAAFAEKLVNSIDAILIRECMAAGIAPDSPAAPKSIRDAVSRLIEGKQVGTHRGGLIKDWDKKLRTDVSRKITIAATGNRGKGARGSYTITDQGEGQTPLRLPHTILSLQKGNKDSLHFVQGRYNQGGTGALGFCGKNNLQLVISKRCPEAKEFTKEIDISLEKWGFSIIRREFRLGKQNSLYTYLAPILGEELSQTREQQVLSFSADYLEVLPYLNQPYTKPLESGTLIKLYEYELRGSSHILQTDGLLRRLDILLPEIALPVRMHECRDFKGSKGSYDNTLTGLVTRIEDDAPGSSEPLEIGFPIHGQIFVPHCGEFTVRIYAFKRDKLKTYARRDEAVLLTINGQVHAALSSQFFHRRRVNLSRVANDLLVLMDCTGMDPRVREDLFMASRDRMKDIVERRELETALEIFMGSNSELKHLAELRRNEDFAKKLLDDKPLQDTLKKLITANPMFSSLFSKGQQIENPIKPKQVMTEPVKFVGRAHPSYFRFAKRSQNEVLLREFHAGQLNRLRVETDVVDNYFSRSDVPGSMMLQVFVEGESIELGHNFSMKSGSGVFDLRLSDLSLVGKTIYLQISVSDPTLIDPLIAKAELKVLSPVDVRAGGKRSTPHPPGEKPGIGRDAPEMLQVPGITCVKHEDWDKHGFDEKSACKAMPDETSADSGSVSYEFYINIDNTHLVREMRMAPDQADVLRSQYIYGNVLLGLALLRSKSNHSDNGDDQTGEKLELVEMASGAISPFLLPMLRTLGSLGAADIIAPDDSS